MENEALYAYYLQNHRFPTEISLYDGFNRLIDADYLFDPKLTKQSINKLTEICNTLLKERILILFGDIFLETLQAGLYSFLQVKNLKVQYLDCQQEDLKEYLSNTLITSSLFKHTVLYVCDFFESLSRDVCFYLVNKKVDIQQSNRLVIGLCYDTGKLNPGLFSKFRKIRVNTPTDDRFHLQRCVTAVFTDTNRSRAMSYLAMDSDWLEYLFTLLAFNLPHFYSNLQEIQHNTTILHLAHSFFKYLPQSRVISLLVTGIILAKRKRVVLFPPKKEKEVKTHEKINEENSL